ncbi:unnamed protein product [Prorocentrum cordatum]|uniref:Uncharacterized protein n=1 Tax=Prorocentrum cordatum TaxID=2364126 RepID=A0ABN9TFE2_9DINO|nr:unnamed protein product [Polarella glacialis]
MAKLATLDLAGNQLGMHDAGGAEALAEDLAKMKKLGGQAGGAETLAEGLAKLEKLAILDLAGNRLGRHAGHAEAFAEALAKMEKLATLDLAGNHLGSRGCAAVCGALPRGANCHCF